jgi:hypothetical protein
MNKQGILCTHCGSTVKLGLRQLAALAGWRSVGSLEGHIKAHPSGDGVTLSDDSHQAEASSHQNPSEHPQEPLRPSADISRKNPEQDLNAFEDDAQQEY